jgi:hypothetical protein
MWQAIRRVWAPLARRKESAQPLPEVIIHDPAAQRAQDLDDPFLDQTAQARVADLIAKARRKNS